MLYLSLSLELDSPRVKSPNNVYLFWLLTTFVLSFVLSSNNKNSFAGLHASRKWQLCTDHAGGKIQMTKFKIVKQHICLAMKMSPIFFWLYQTFSRARYLIFYTFLFLVKSASISAQSDHEWNLWNPIFDDSGTVDSFLLPFFYLPDFTNRLTMGWNPFWINWFDYSKHVSSNPH